MLKIACLFFLLLTIASVSLEAQESTDKTQADKNIAMQQKDCIIPPVVKEKYQYYEVWGICEKDLHGDLKQKCITLTDGKKYDSITMWKINWDYGYNSTVNTCKADNFIVNVEVTFRLPKWVPTDKAPHALVDKWDTFVRHLLTHEKGHRDLAIAAAAKLARSVAELPPMQTCADIDKEVQALSRVRMKELKEEEKEYDVTTNHGQTQGAFFR
jgi:predicted secreted Zn-dependent protease